MGNDMEIKDEKSYIFDKTMKCNVCNKEFTTKQVAKPDIQELTTYLSHCIQE